MGKEPQAEKKKQKLIRWQKSNVGVLYALIAPSLASIYFFGWRSLLLITVVAVTGFLTEYVFLRAYYREPVSSAVFVSSMLFTLSLPPSLPVWMAVVGIVFGIALGKMAFGGFGRNIFNPALTGRAFIYISFGGWMNGGWLDPIGGIPGGFGTFISDAVSSATPMAVIAGGSPVDRINLIFGNISGCLGETSALLLLLGGLYLMIKKYANYRIVVSAFASTIVLNTVLRLSGAPGVIDTVSAVLGGGYMIGMLYMATDPVSASQTTNTGRWIYGSVIGILTVIIRSFSIWPGGVMFAILTTNMFAPLLDYYMKKSKSRGNAK